ncbi:cation acetate symporter [Streptantibioticus rubrisoli]|uniref:Cation acetate symporter n=1 Tax=Streptantibioticus rubrisoli TaxID=1387313 RepID=A0ABT1P574_9ACTN|nr:cation acetate symporter [Streptantibioticus rubrisoli]MCQ4040505.1 cation acetate symporter [Streptantibioticus rubrisoli]
MTVQLAAGATGNPAINVGIFLAFVAVTLFIVYKVSSSSPTASDYYAAGSAFNGVQNGVALSGDFLSAASFLGISGAIAVHGYDGFLYSVGWVVAWLVALLLIGERLRNTGRFTVGDVMAFRMKQRPVRAAAANATLVITFFYMLAQMAGAGGLIALLLHVQSKGGQALIITGVGAVMVFYVLVGGMKGTTWVQIVKATLLLLCVTLIGVFLLGKFGFSFSQILEHAAQNSPSGERILDPGAWYGKNAITELDFVSLALSLVLGISSLPHVLMRFYTVPNAKEARSSVVWCSWAMVIFYLGILVVGYGATALVGSDTILRAPGGENSAAPLLAFKIGGEVLLGIVCAVAFATILAVVAGLTLAAAASFAHDVYANVVRNGDADPRSEVRVARLTAVVIGCLAIVGGIVANGQNVAFLVSLALALAASANLSTMLYTLYWKRFNTTGTLWSIYGGLASCLVLIIFSPAISGTPTSIVKSVDFHWFPLTNPGIVSIPLSFLCGYLGTVFSKQPADPGKQAEMEVRALTGLGVKL